MASPGCWQAFAHWLNQQATKQRMLFMTDIRTQCDTFYFEETFATAVIFQS